MIYFPRIISQNPKYYQRMNLTNRILQIKFRKTNHIPPKTLTINRKKTAYNPFYYKKNLHFEIYLMYQQ